MYPFDLHCVLHRLATSSCHGHVDESTGLCMSLHREHGIGCRHSCSRPLLFAANWKHVCSSLHIDTGKQTVDCSVMRPRSPSNTNDSGTVTCLIDLTNWLPHNTESFHFPITNRKPIKTAAAHCHCTRNTSKWLGSHWMSVTLVMWLCSIADTAA